MDRIAIIFADYGNPNKPFWNEWYHDIKEIEGIDFRAYTSTSRLDNPKEIKGIKTRSRIELLRNMIRVALSGKAPTRNRARFLPLSQIDAPVVHIHDAQMFFRIKKHLHHSPKFVVSFRGYETLVRPHSDLQWKMELLKIFESASYLHFVSDYIKNAAIALGASEDKCITIHRSVDTDTFKPKESSLKGNEKPLILSVGRLVWQKGYLYGLEAMRILRQMGVSFNYRIIGTGVDLKQINYMIKEFELDRNVSIVSSASRKELKEHFSEADLFLHASVSEALPNVVLEASSMGIPIVATNVGGVSEAVEDLKTGRLIAPRDSLGLAQVLKQIIENKEMATKYGASARSKMIDEFSGQKAKSQWEKLFLKALKAE